MQERAVNLMISLASAAAVLAIIDYVFTRQSYMKRLRMSRREVKEEMRQSEGDPMIKAKLRQVRMERSRRRMLSQVPKASVVVMPMCAISQVWMIVPISRLTPETR